jgi:hypothetical protein
MSLGAGNWSGSEWTRCSASNWPPRQRGMRRLSQRSARFHVARAVALPFSGNLTFAVSRARAVARRVPCTRRDTAKGVGLTALLDSHQLDHHRRPRDHHAQTPSRVKRLLRVYAWFGAASARIRTAVRGVRCWNQSPARAAPRSAPAETPACSGRRAWTPPSTLPSWSCASAGCPNDGGATMTCPVVEADLFGPTHRSGLSQKKSVTSRLSNDPRNPRDGRAGRLRRSQAP